MGVKRETDGDGAELNWRGQQAFWAGRPFDWQAEPTWHQGWLAAAAEAQRTLEENRPYLEARADVRNALTEARAAIRALIPAKPRPRQSELARTATGLIELALMKTEWSTAGGVPARVVDRADVSGRARAGRR